jgi:hypothetical protein
VGLVSQALAQTQADDSPAPSRPSPPPPAATPGPDLAGQLAADLRTSLRGIRLRTLLRTRRLTVRLHHTYPAGRFGLVATAGRKTIARGSLTAKLTRQGAARLRHARRARLQIALSFTPRSGDLVMATRAVTLRR